MIPVDIESLIVGVCAARGQEVPALGDVLLSLLPTDFDLLLFTATSKIIWFQSSFGFVGCGKENVSTRQYSGQQEKGTMGRDLVPSLRALVVLLSLSIVLSSLR